MNNDSDLCDTLLPITKLSLGFPNEKNFIQRQFELFQMNEIAFDKYHIALSILLDKLDLIIKFANKIPKLIEELNNRFINDNQRDIQYFSKIECFYDDIISNKKKENEIIQKCENLIQKEKENFQKIDYTYEDPKEIKKCKKNIKEISIARTKFLNDIKEENIRISYFTLLKRNDQIESIIYSRLAEILFKKEFITSAEVERILNNYNQMKLLMENFDPKLIKMVHAKEIRNEVFKIIEQIDPNLSANSDHIIKYKHSLPTSRWIISAVELSMNLYALSNYEERLLQKKGNSILSQKAYNDSLEVKYFLEKINVKKELEEALTVSQKLEEIFKSYSDYYSNLINMMVSVTKNGFDLLNKDLECESFLIRNLYKRFDRKYSQFIPTHKQSKINNPYKIELCSRENYCTIINCFSTKL